MPNPGDNSLKTYSHSIGVTYYLVNRLAQYPEEEVEFYWPQLWSVGPGAGLQLTGHNLRPQVDLSLAD